MKFDYSYMGPFATETYTNKYAHTIGRGDKKRKETWPEIARRVPSRVFKAVDADSTLVNRTVALVRDRILMPGGRYLYAAGKEFHQTNNCFLFRAEDSREGWADLMQKATLALMTGGGIGVHYGRVREEGALIRRTGGHSTGPMALMEMTNEGGRFIMQGGSRRSAIWAGLPWDHPDIMKFIRMKDWSTAVRALKEKDFNFPGRMDLTNISVCLDDAFFKAYKNSDHPKHTLAHAVYWETIERMLKTGEPGFSVNLGSNSNEILRNACTEVTSETDSDVCNLVSVNLARIQNKDQFRDVLELSVALAMAGTVYSDVPFPQVDIIRSQNRRLGIGLMGVHEWLLVRGKKYGPDDELAEYLEIYRDATDYAAEKYADLWRLSVPIKKRAIAPNGTIGIVAETTTGIEPILASAYKRRYLDGRNWKYMYVVDPTAKRLVEKFGVKPADLEDAYSLARDVNRRIEFNAFVQDYVDHGISSTINLPQWGSQWNNHDHIRPFGNRLMNYLPRLRGITVYPDGGRGGQPLTAIKYETAMKHEGTIFEETMDVCEITGAGSCGV